MVITVSKPVRAWETALASSRAYLRMERLGEAYSFMPMQTA
jgi:hypothetical protein